MTPVVRSLIATILLGACLACGCRGSAGPRPSPSATVSASAPLSGMSVYNLQSKWTDQDGRGLKLEQLRGQPRVIAMVYTSCHEACPRLIADMKAIEKQLSPQEKARVGFVLVSIDPEVDTTQRLHDFARGLGVGPQWCLLRGKAADVEELAATLNFRYRKTSATEFAHSNVITVLGIQGEIVHQQSGVHADSSETLAAIHAQLR